MAKYNKLELKLTASQFKFINHKIYALSISNSSIIFTEMYPICFRLVRYRMIDELNSRILLDERCGYICDSGFLKIEDAKFLRDVSASYRKGKLRMQNFNEKYPQIQEKARCRCNCI